jgi:hypothetical protein
MSKSRIPGTFKVPQPVLRRDLSVEGAAAERLLTDMGSLHAERWRVGECSVMLSRDPLAGRHFRWHLSIAHPSRYPSWDEIKTAAYGIEALQGVMLAQVLHPGDGTPWVNLHENCFHLYEIDDEAMREQLRR